MTEQLHHDNENHMLDSRYSPWIRHLHWLIFILVACALALIYLRSWSPRGSTLGADAKWAHMQFGIAILLVMLPRLLVRSQSGSAPPILPPSPRWQMVIAKIVHVVLYLLLFATPILGIATMAWLGKPWNFLGLALPSVPTPNHEFSQQLQGIHETLGHVLMYLAGAHAVMALFHHFFQRDNTLKRMLPPVRAEV
ncbi:MAG: cytochrome b [Rudaea sp.]